MKALFKLSIIVVVLALVPVMAEAQGRTPRNDSAAVGVDVGLFRPSESEKVLLA